MTAQVITRSMVDRAWQEQVIATDLYVIAGMENMKRDVMEQRREEMVQATKHAQDLQEMYSEQYDCRIYSEAGQWQLAEVA